MSAGNVSSSISQPPRAPAGNFKRVKEDQNAVARALNQGDAAGAQRAFASLRKDTPTPSEIGSSNSKRTRAEQGVGEFQQLADVQRQQAAKLSTVPTPDAPRPVEPTEKVGRSINVLA